MWEIQLGLILLMMELMDVSNNTLGKAAMAKGLSNYIFTTYTHGIAVFFLIPLAYLYHRFFFFFLLILYFKSFNKLI